MKPGFVSGLIFLIAANPFFAIGKLCKNTNPENISLISFVKHRSGPYDATLSMDNHSDGGFQFNCLRLKSRIYNCETYEGASIQVVDGKGRRPCKIKDTRARRLKCENNNPRLLVSVVLEPSADRKNARLSFNNHSDGGQSFDCDWLEPFTYKCKDSNYVVRRRKGKNRCQVTVAGDNGSEARSLGTD